MTFSLPGSRFPVRVRFAGFMVLCMVLYGSSGSAQAPAFDAVSVKINTSGEQSSRFGGRPGGLQISNNTLRSLIRNIWNLNGLQIVGGPAWMDDTRFDILATVSGNPNRDQMIAMAKAMMADRFKLVVHTETRPIPVYALVLARKDGTLGPNLRQSSLTTCNPATPPAPGTPPPPAPPQLDGVDIPACGTSTNSGILRAGGVRLDSFTRNMANAAGRIIVDRTGLTGAFDMVLRFNPDPNNPSSDLPTLFAAVKEQLGLAFDAQTAPTEVLVVDSAQQPTEN